MGLIQLIYVSTAHHEFSSDNELEAILASSVRHNKPSGITGMLVYAEGSFIQVLEGEKALVMETMERISKDLRHHMIIQLDCSEISTRKFSKWSMGFRRLNREDIDANPDFAPIIGGHFDPNRVGATPSLALDMLEHFGGR